MLVLMTQSTAFAQTATPTAVPFVPGQVWAYRFVVTGPSSALAGSEVTYRVSYDLVIPENYGTAGFVFVYPLDGVTFVSSAVVEGPQGVMSVQTEHSIRWDFNERLQSGAAEVTLRINPDAPPGDLTVAIYVPGTEIYLPGGSVDHVTTHVTSASGGSGTTSLPTTGAGQRVSTSPISALLLLAVGGVITLTAGAALRARRR
jgi:hypothetical protein